MTLKRLIDRGDAETVQPEVIGVSVLITAGFSYKGSHSERFTKLQSGLCLALSDSLLLGAGTFFSPCRSDSGLLLVGGGLCGVVMMNHSIFMEGELDWLLSYAQLLHPGYE